jgi:hypothetical protein
MMPATCHSPSHLLLLRVTPRSAPLPSPLRRPRVAGSAAAYCRGAVCGTQQALNLTRCRAPSHLTLRRQPPQPPNGARCITSLLAQPRQRCPARFVAQPSSLSRVVRKLAQRRPTATRSPDIELVARGKTPAAVTRAVVRGVATRRPAACWSHEQRTCRPRNIGKSYVEGYRCAPDGLGLLKRPRTNAPHTSKQTQSLKQDLLDATNGRFDRPKPGDPDAATSTRTFSQASHTEH